LPRRNSSHELMVRQVKVLYIQIWNGTNMAGS
jgi:hypothetical protein